MPTSKEHKALQRYINHLALLFNQTITDSRIGIIRWDKDFKSAVIARYVNGRIMPLELRPCGWLHFQQILHVQSRLGKIIVDSYCYIYSLSDDPDNENDWAFRYEYNLNPAGHVPHAHVHINSNWGCNRLNANILRRVHFPTERISIEKVIAHLIIEYGIQCRKRDWLKFLADSHFHFASKLRIDPPMFP